MCLGTFNLAKYSPKNFHIHTYIKAADKLNICVINEYIPTNRVRNK